MRTKIFQLVLSFVVIGFVCGMVNDQRVFAQETPTETPTEAPTQTEETPTATPEATPVGETPTTTPVPPTATPETPTPAPEPAELSIGSFQGTVGEEIGVEIMISNATNLDAFGFDISQSNAILEFISVDVTGSLTEGFQEVNGQAIAAQEGAVRIGAVGGAESVSGEGLLLTVLYTATAAGETNLTISNLVDDLANAAIVAGSVAVTGETATETPTEAPSPTEAPPSPTPTPETPEETPTPPEPSPTEESPTATPPEPSPTEETDTPTPTAIPSPTPSPRVTGEPTQVPIRTPQPTPTAFTLNPVIGIVSLDVLGGTYPRGNAVHNFDIGISDQAGNLIAPNAFDGLVDPQALGPFLFIDGAPVPIAQDMEFSGEIAADGNGSEGVYFLNGGNISDLPPVSVRLGATGGPNGGGIDTDNDPSNNVRFPGFQGDIVPVFFQPDDNSFFSPLVDIEPAGNDGFYVLSDDGRIHAEGSANESLDTAVQVTEGASAVDFKIFRGLDIVTSNSTYSEDLVGTGAYVLDSQGAIHVVGDAPALNTDDQFVAPQPVSATSRINIFQDIELMPNEAGTTYIGVTVLTGDALVTYVPFADVEVTADIQTYVQNVTPFGTLQIGLGFDIARDIEFEVSDQTIYGLDEEGNTVPITGRRVGTFLFDGFGGTHTGGLSTRYAPAFNVGTQYMINGVGASPFPVDVPFFGADVVKDAEIALPVQR